MSTAIDEVNDLIVAHWKSQTVYAGAALGVFDRLGAGETKDAETLASELDVHPGLLYRLLRALASLGLLSEDGSYQFAITANGALLRDDHPQSLRDRALLNGGREHYVIWSRLADLIAEKEDRTRSSDSLARRRSNTPAPTTATAARSTTA